MVIFISSRYRQEAIVLASSKLIEFSKAKCIERSVHHDNFIVKNAVETSVVQAAKNVN